MTLIKNLETQKIIEVLSNNCIGHLAYISKRSPHVLPITYYYDETDKSIICYSDEGHKINAMRKNVSISLAVSEIESINNWQSILIQGVFEELKGSDAKYWLHRFTEGVKDNMSHKGAKELQFTSDFSITTNSMGVPIVYRIRILEITGKLRQS